MRFLPPEAEVTLYETVFDNDILDRTKVSKSLSALLDRIEDPLVIALDGRWGTGKSYFLKRWVGAHQRQNDGKALTLYFDAFANDYLSDPLVALVSALTDRIPKEDIEKLERLKSAATKFIKPLARIGLNIATFGAKEGLNDLGDAVADAFGGEAAKTVDNFWQQAEGRQAAMENFRDALSKLVEGPEGGNPTPLVIVIDELDRCRPDYALEVLEVIKHFFAVPMVHFVLGVNTTALANSVKARYGHDIDASAYLQKFVSLTVALPDRISGQHQSVPTVLTYAKHTAKAMDLPEEYVEEIVERQLPVVLRNNSVSIRDVGKILGAVAILPPAAITTQLLMGWRSTAASMIIARVVNRDIFNKMLNASLSDDELVAYLGATPEKIMMNMTDSERNQAFDHPTWIMYHSWKFILSNGVDRSTDEIDIGSGFSQYGHIQPAKTIPHTIYDDWLSTFDAP
jgi:hypothetical protein